ncbi:hypothetical protein FRC12_004769 [Ceratobasidium sp. 428]|nr:hypothetical protein FRC12_004769 [Ceratobasidium sp. 428]
MGGLVDASERLTMDPVFDMIKAEVPRWRSLDIAFSCISHTSKVTQYLADLKETVHLDSLTIGPMGFVSLLIDDDTIGGTYPGTVFRSADPTQAKSLLQQTNIQPVALRIDTYPVAFSPIMFSHRLTRLEVFAGNYYTHSLDLNEWHQILSSTPQLVNLRLWSPRHWKIDLVESKMFMPLHLADLQVLELAGSFIILGPLFVKASLPMLDHLLLDSLGTSISVPQQVAEFASVSPALTRLHVGSVCFSPDSISSVWWTKAFESMHSLQALSLVEMEWLEAASALIQLASTSHRLSHIVLKGIWDIDPATLARLQAADSGLPPLEIIDCTTGQPARCVNLEHIAKGCDCDLDTRSNGDSDAGSNYSDNSSFEYTNGFPSSVFDSEGSEISYGEDEGSEMGLVVQQ